ncbi:MAG: hypothetical protein CSA75_05385, partial [Sorangium cellulosum]
LHAVSTLGDRKKLVDRAWPSSTFDIGDYDPKQIVAFEAEGFDASGKKVLRGATIFHSLWTLEGTQVPIFVGRTNEMSRPTGELGISRTDGVAAIVDGRFIVSLGGSNVRNLDGSAADPATFAAYDMGEWVPSKVHETFPRTPRTLAIVQGRFGLAIDDAGASWYDFATNSASDVEPPVGVTFADLAGGQVIYGESETYVVGPTRDKSSSTVLRIALDGALSAIRLDAPRAGVAATYVGDRGLVIAGGHDTEPGAILLTSEATSFAPLAFSPDPVQGAGAVDIGNGQVLLSGGRNGPVPAATRILDLACTAHCEPSRLSESLDPVGVSFAWVRATSPDEVIVVGPQDTSKATQVIRIHGLNTAPVMETLSLRKPRYGATPLKIFGRC